MGRALDSTPAADGFRMPAEWEPHAGTWMAWPERPDTWRDGAEPARIAFAEVARAIAASEPVTVTASPTGLESARSALPASCRVVELATDDAWMRDIGPTFVVDDAGERRGVDWIFNAWGGLQGGLYAPWDRDDAAASAILELERVGRYRAPMVLEGGAIHTDGEGTLLTTEECVLDPNRNPLESRSEIERHLREHLGVETVIWLGLGVFQDETGGHVDNLVCFVRPGVVALTWTDDRDDPQYERSLDARRRLEAATDARGRSLEVHLVHQPGPLSMTDAEAAGLLTVDGSKPRRAGDRLAASYVNFFIANTRVVVPRLDERHDDQAHEQLAALFPEREVVGVDAREILLGGGNVHCITQQVPAGRGIDGF
jgi:agmatine deiminase